MRIVKCGPGLMTKGKMQGGGGIVTLIFGGLAANLRKVYNAPEAGPR